VRNIRHLTWMNLVGFVLEMHVYYKIVKNAGQEIMISLVALPLRPWLGIGSCYITWVTLMTLARLGHLHVSNS
jgi:hypothetical protein